MSYRQVIVAKKSHLSVDTGKISIDQDGFINLIPLEDVTIVVVDSMEVTFSASFFVECAIKNISVVICGRNHMPASISTSLNQHYRPYQVVEFQICQTEEMKDFITEKLLKSKVSNQLCVVKLTSDDQNAVNLLERYILEIVKSDEINREGIAAKVFFNSLYGDDFTRFADDPINMALNYGYGVLRSSITRAVNSYGLTAYIGVKHCGKTNPFNLVYDLIEPFRAVIDYYVHSNLHLLVFELPMQVRKELVNILNAIVVVNEKKFTVQYAIELLVKSYLRFIEYGETTLDLPEIIEIKFDKLNEHL